MKITNVMTNGSSDRQWVSLQVEPDDATTYPRLAPPPIAIQKDVRDAIIHYMGGYTQDDIERQGYAIMPEGKT